MNTLRWFHLYLLIAGAIAFQHRGLLPFLHLRPQLAQRLERSRLAFAKKSKSASTSAVVDDSKRAALEDVINSIQRCYGQGSIQKLGDHEHMKVATTPTGCLNLDVALGGGLPKGRITEIYGPESSGKTTLALHAVAEVQKAGGVAAFVDAEHALDPAYAAKLGVNVDDLLICQPDTGEMGLDVADQLVKSSAVDCVVVDSVAALVPRAELEGEMTDQQMGLQARLMSKALRKLTGSLGKSNAIVIFLNQLRSKIGVMFGNPEVTSGGNALKFYSSVRLDIRRKETLKEGAGMTVKVKVVKNKIAPPLKTVEFDILFGEGIDVIGCLLDAAEGQGVVERKGAWYAMGDQKLGQGRVNTIELLKKDEKLLKEIDRQTRLALVAPYSDDDEHE